MLAADRLVLGSGPQAAPAKEHPTVFQCSAWVMGLQQAAAVALVILSVNPFAVIIAHVFV
jgi:hypothetical protein